MVERLLPLKETTKLVRFSHQNHIANSVLLVLLKWERERAVWILC